MVVLKNQNRRSGIFYLRPLCGFGFFSKSDFSAIFFSHFRSSTDSFLKFSLSRLQINAKYACSVSLSWLTISPAVSSISFSGLSSGTLKKSSLCVSRRARAIPFSGSGRSTLSRRICEQRQLPMKQVYFAEYGMGGTPPTSGSTRCISTDGAPLIRCSCAVLRIYYQKSRDNKRSSVSLLFELLLSLHRYLLRSFSN